MRQHRQPRRGQNRRQRQRVEPKRQPDPQTGARRPRIAPAAQRRHQQVRGELGHRRKGHEADRGERAFGRDQQVPRQRQRHNGHDRHPPGDQQPLTDRAPARRASAANDRREDQIVRNHGGKRGRIDDHHRGGRADPPQQRRAQQPRLAQRGGQRQHVKVGRDMAAQQSDAGQRNRQHQQGHNRQIGGKAQPGARQIFRLASLDQRHVELARQHQHRHHRDHQNHRDIMFERAGAEGRHQLLHPGGARGDSAFRQGVERKARDQRQRDQLDHRFEPDGVDQPLAPPRQLEAARAEQNGEQRQHHCRRDHHRHRDIAPRSQRQRRADRAQLEGDVRHRAGQRDHRHQPRDHHVMPEAGGDEIGDGRSLFLGHRARQQGQKAWGQQQQQQRPDIDRQIGPAIAHRAADRAIEGPAGAIDPQPQRIGDQPHPAKAGQRTALDQRGHREQCGHHAQRKQ